MIPLVYKWQGDAMIPLPRFAKLADKQFVVGQDYRLDEVQERSQASHNQFFAAIADAWDSLPEEWAARLPSPEHLRKFALVRAGYADERSIVASSRAEALRIAAFIKPMDEYAVVTVKGAVVRVYTAQSQSMKAMGKADFQASRNAVLEVCAAMLGVKPDELVRWAGRAA
jgi:hypothetical protein